MIQKLGKETKEESVSLFTYGETTSAYQMIDNKGEKTNTC